MQDKHPGQRAQDTDRRHLFLVIGAGPVGLAVAKALKERGLPYEQVDATDHVGGNWAHGVYSTAHIISSRKTTEYTDYPMPEDYPDFPSARQMCAYFEDYAETFGLRDNIRFETKVEAIRPRADELWDVHFEGGQRLIYKGVMVCNGHHWCRNLPRWTERFEGTLLHSKDYKHPDQLRDKRVLVLGGGNSGCDMVSEAARVGESADWSLRRGYWFIPKTFFGRPSIEMMRPWVPVPIQRSMVKALIRVTVGRYSDYGLPVPDHEIFEAHPSISSEVFHYLKHGRITPRPDVHEVDGDTIVFTDGTRRTYDLVACATGFKVAFPFLPAGMVPYKDPKTPILHGGMSLPTHRHLYLVGAYQARYGLGPLVRPLAVLLAHWAELQDDLEAPMGRLLQGLGMPPVTDHLTDPFDALQKMWLAGKLDPLLRWQDRKVKRVWREEREARARGLAKVVPARGEGYRGAAATVA